MSETGATVGLAIIAKTPEPGKSKTRLSPPLTPVQCACISAAFIADLADNIAALAEDAPIRGVALYTPIGSEARLRQLLPADFALVPQADGDLGARLSNGIADMRALGHSAAIIVSSDSPTLPRDIFMRAAAHLLAEDCLVLCPAYDGGYTFIGLRQPHARLFEDMPWSTEVVFERTCERAAEIGLRLHVMPMWYDVDDAETLAILTADLAGDALPFATETLPRMPAPRTKAFLAGLDAPELRTHTPGAVTAS
jgi:rSAM/selenodomain-associated transferase 1